MDAGDVRHWFDEYLAAFEACGRGESEAPSLLAYYGVPLLITSDAGSFTMTSDDQVVAFVRRHIDGLRAAAYGRSETLEANVTLLNRTSALYRATFCRRRHDGDEIGRLTATYLVTDGERGRRISVLSVHSS